LENSLHILYPSRVSCPTEYCVCLRHSAAAGTTWQGKGLLATWVAAQHRTGKEACPALRTDKTATQPGTARCILEPPQPLLPDCLGCFGGHKDAEKSPGVPGPLGLTPPGRRTGERSTLSHHSFLFVTGHVVQCGVLWWGVIGLVGLPRLTPSPPHIPQS
jgi:hypothetical protein